MSLRRQLSWSLLIQGAGAGAVLLATLLLGIAAGPEQQGRFSHAKAEIELVGAIAMLGLPQALFFFVNSSRMSLRAAVRWVWRGAFFAVVLIGMYGLRRYGVEQTTVLIALVLAGMFSASHGQFRTLLLATRSTAAFNAVTALPQILVALGVCILLLLQLQAAAPWELLFATAYGASAGVAFKLLPRDRVEQGGSVGWLDLQRYGAAAWLLPIMSTAAIFFVQSKIQTTLGLAALGLFTMCMTVVQIPLAPIGYAVPLLFRRWMAQPDASTVKWLAMLLFFAMLGVAAITWVIAPHWPRLGLGPAYEGATAALAILLAGAAAEAALRVLTASTYANGLPWISVKSELARWVLLGLGWLAFPSPTLLVACAMWAAGAWVATAVMAAYVLQPGDVAGRPIQ